MLPVVEALAAPRAGLGRHGQGGGGRGRGRRRRHPGQRRLGLAVAGGGPPRRGLGGHAPAGDPGHHAGRPPLRRRGGRGGAPCWPTGPPRPPPPGWPRSGSTRASASARPSTTTSRCWRRLGRPGGHGGYPVLVGHQPQALPRGPGRRARRARRPRSTTGSRARWPRPLGHGSRGRVWSGSTTWPPPCRPRSWWAAGPGRTRDDAERRSDREGQVGGRHPAAELHLGHQGPPGHERAARAASPPTTARCAARRRSSGCRSRGSTGWSRCCRRRTTCRPTRRSPWPASTTRCPRSGDVRGVLGDVYRDVHGRLAAGERILVHQEELGRPGHRAWSPATCCGRTGCPTGPQAITVLEHLTGHPMGPAGRELVASPASWPRCRPRTDSGHRPTGVTAAGAATAATGSSCAGCGCVGTHGVLPEEQERAQPFEVDLDLAVDLRPAGVSATPWPTPSTTARWPTWWPPRVSGPALLRACSRPWPGTWPTPCSTSTTGSTAVDRALRKLRPPLAVDIDTVGRAGGPPPVTVAVGRAAHRCGPSWPWARTWATAGPTCAGRSTSSGPGSDPAVTAVSRVYETEPVGGPDDQGAYLNLVVELAVPPPVDPYRLLEQCRRLEAAAGRVRTVRWGPRTLDADVLWIDGVVARRPRPDRAPPPVAGAAVRPGPAGRAGPGPGRRRTTWTAAGGEVRGRGYGLRQQFLDFLMRTAPSGAGTSKGVS